MTTPWKVPELWPGKTVAVIGDGPDLTDEALAAAKSYPSIAANNAISRAPWADMLVSIDGNWPPEAEDFAGLRVVGNESSIDALYVNMPHEIVTLAPGHVVHIRNNALAAIRIAAQGGAVKILLLGFDTEAYEALHDFRGLTEGLAALIAELQTRGVAIERIGNPQDIRMGTAAPGEALLPIPEADYEPGPMLLDHAEDLPA